MPKDTFLAFVEQSGLSGEDKMFWKHAVSLLEEEQISVFEHYVDGDRKRLAYLTENVKRKRDAFVCGDTVALNALVQEEKTALQQQ